MKDYAALRLNWFLILGSFVLFVVMLNGVIGRKLPWGPLGEVLNSSKGLALLIPLLLLWASVGWTLLQVRPRATETGWEARDPQTTRTNGLVACAFGELAMLLTIFLINPSNATLTWSVCALVVVGLLAVVHPKVMASFKISEIAGIASLQLR